MRGRSRSSGRWLKEHFSDPFVKRAQSGTYRSRAIFKLEEIDRRVRLLRPGAVCLDLGAAPGAWSQYVSTRVTPNGRVVATDIVAMAPLAGVEFVQGDFRTPHVFSQILACCGRGAVDVLLSDMAPNFSGVDAIDQPRAMHLSELAIEMARCALKPQGAALIKVFQGAGFETLLSRVRSLFSAVKLLKPQASRSRSPELYLLAKALVMV